jgi:site-specific DNA-cytosine methylase
MRVVAYGGGVQSTALLVLAAQERIDFRTFLIANVGEDRYGDRAGTDALRLEVWQALVLQSFPRDYPLYGTRTEQFQQVGDAMPPLLARHMLAEVLP